MNCPLSRCCQGHVTTGRSKAKNEKNADKISLQIVWFTTWKDQNVPPQSVYRLLSPRYILVKVKVKAQGQGYGNAACGPI